MREHFRGDLRARLMTRLSTRQYHLRQWSKTFKAYREIAFRFERAQVTELQRADGSVHRFAVMRMPAGDQKQLTYDLTARIVDSDELPTTRITGMMLVITFPGRPGPSRCCVSIPPAARTGRSTRRSSPSCAPPSTRSGSCSSPATVQRLSRSAS